MERAAAGNAAGDAARNGQAGAGPRDLACLGETAPEALAAELPGGYGLYPLPPARRHSVIGTTSHSACGGA
jgi:hypothetical protein